MESKGSIRSGNKPDPKTTSSGKPEKPNPGPATVADKKEAPSKEQPAPAASTPAKKAAAAAANEAAMLNNHGNMKPSSTTATTESPEAANHPADSEHEGNNAEESPGSSIFENMKPLILVGGAVVAAVALIVGVAILARKK
ncbi:cell cycle exit and neuronal differentiation protein 1 [Rhineura floridana]|uniref:cell cycle exit and neuronal differentiation protein 1 n=1 Tax=Rhineura floridana TaxID=261503 RepID=UPI002AC8420B|nr:cell cycle exit and neuronal differentiation protein 1 [Rhineura floridana]XP_061466017.1 cell cycle exit and neuronal differentiation protein 1 [Rhineura floridana]XP_061466018.1 cell cycle exit and neuronal differentiation protein 1 [Rhineura floridana]XP_061466019.1 cell cycle exit and neuronal differentiation protein 1 [Rhineura floridana]